MGKRIWGIFGVALASLFCSASPSWAATTGELQVMADTLWVLIAGFLVFFMNTGFGCVEAGFCRAKNAVNILGKNFVVFGIASIAFWAIGWSLMFGDGSPFMGISGFFLSGADNSPATGDAYQGVYSSISWTGVPLLAKFFFQLVFAGTAATIVSGCVAERIHYKSFMFFTVFITAIAYPITGHWIWGGGWLAELGFWDFAGSTVVHSVGGWAGLAGIVFLGARMGKYRPAGEVQAIPGHSMALAFLGGMILWLGWFGFNPGSTMAADPGAIAHIVITTNLACAGGLITATMVSWMCLGKPDFSMTVNGALAGLVAITAPCAWVQPWAAVLIGIVGGGLVVGSVLFFDRIRIDDPVGALSVHLSNGIWGTLAIGIFAVGPSEAGLYSEGPAAGLLYGGVTQLIYQLVGVIAVGVFTFGVSAAVWIAIRNTVGLRVEEDVEIAGLDVTEMGMEAYNGFQVVDPHEHVVPETTVRSAMAPPGGGERFSIVVEGVKNGDLMHSWNELCQPTDNPPEAFRAIYPYMTTVKGNSFHFRGGDPEDVKRHLEKLFEGRFSSPITTHLEK